VAIEALAARARERRVVVRFDDDEVAVGYTHDLDLDRSQFTLRIHHRSNNSRAAIVPLASVTRIVLEHEQVAEPIPDDVVRKVALHFWDGRVETGLLQNLPHRQRHGMVLELFSSAADTSELLALPYHALKAMFFLRTWDTRSPQLRRHAGGAHWMLPEHEAPLIDLPSEIRGLRGLRYRGDVTPVEFERRRLHALTRV
jgi:hypothetical protein